MLPKDKTRIVLVVEKAKARYLDSLASLFGWSKSKTGAVALNIGMARLAWSYEIVHKRWKTASEGARSEALHWLYVAGLLPDAMFDEMEKELDVDAERKKWRAASETLGKLADEERKAK